jgi:hypothetical protein
MRKDWPRVKVEHECWKIVCDAWWCQLIDTTLVVGSCVVNRCDEILDELVEVEAKAKETVTNKDNSCKTVFKAVLVCDLHHRFTESTLFFFPAGLLSNM